MAIRTPARAKHVEPRSGLRSPLRLTDLILHVPGFLSDAQCRLLIKEHRGREREARSEHSPEATTGVVTYASFKAVTLLKGTKAFALAHDATEEMVNRYHEHLDRFGAFHVMRRGSMTYSRMYRVLRYDEGAKIHAHTDHAPFVYGSCTFNLNDDYRGGGFSFFNGAHKVALGKGDAIVWPADFFWVHEVEEITEGTRYSTNSFLQSLPESVLNEVLHFADKSMASYRATPRVDEPTRFKIASGRKNRSK